MSVGRLAIDNIVVHDIPKHRRDDGSTQLVLSDVEAVFDTETRLFFQEKIQKAAGSARALRVQFADSDNPKAQQEVYAYFQSNRGSLVQTSRNLVQHLYDIQGGQNSAGLCALIEGTENATARSLMFLKVDRSMATQLAPRGQAGHTGFEIHMLKNLMLYEGNSRLFKLAIFVERSDGIEVTVVDNQVSAHDRQVARFFLRDFLGCDFLVAPDVLTRKFYEITEAFINEVVVDSEIKMDCKLQLVAEMKTQSLTISPERFAGQTFDNTYRASYMDYLREREVSIHEFPKDTTQIQRRLRTQVVEFSSGLTLAGNERALTAKVTVETDKVTISDHIHRITGK